MLYTVTIRGSGLEFQLTDKSPFKAGIAVRKLFDAEYKAQGLKGKAHVSISLSLGDIEVFRAHGMGLRSACQSYRSHLNRMEDPEDILAKKGRR